jgi:eukaryotic-like serine/threonine-protein kinase
VSPHPNTADWNAIKTEFTRVLDLPTHARSAALAAITDANVRNEVASLLLAESQLGDRFERAPTIEPPVRAAPSSSIGDTVGPWRLVRLIGHGGMGTVYEAVRSESGFTKRAAIKMLDRVRANPALLDRFDRERRTLALLEHRNIAALLDGGVDTNGDPWFAMEYVDGERIDRWCAANAPDVRSRVQRFRQVCAAVQYAHEHLVVHRDLKPANILVASDGTVKLLDFGIAKLVDDADSPRTTTGLAPMTAAYASPEQRAGAVLTTATDIYSLGVVLYELLTGARPGDGITTGDSTPVTPSRRVLLEPSTREPRRLTDADAKRAHQQLRGDLDAIVMMALRPEPERRYVSAQALAEDLQQWLDHRPVRARKDTLAYRARMLIRRNPVTTVALGVAVIALVSGIVETRRQTVNAQRERDAALRARARTERVTTFLQEVVSRARPRADGGAVDLITAIDRATPYLDTAFRGEPDLQAQVRQTLANTFGELGLMPQSRRLVDSALAYYVRRDGDSVSHEQANVLWTLSAATAAAGDRAQSDSILHRLLRVYSAGGFPHNDALRARAWLAENRALAGDLRSATTTYDSVIAEYSLGTRDDSIQFATTISNRGSTYVALGNFERGSSDLMRGLQLLTRVNPAETSDRAAAMQPVAMALLFTRKYAEAESVARKALAIKRRTDGEATRSQQGHARALGVILFTAGKLIEADSVFSMIIADRGPLLPDADPTVGFALAHRALARAMRGETLRVTQDAREAVRLYRGQFPQASAPRSLIENVAGAALGLGPRAQWSEARTLLRSGVGGLRASLNAGHPRIVDAASRLREFEERTGLR